MNIQHETIRSVYAVRVPHGILDEAIFLTRQAAEDYARREDEINPFLSYPEVVALEVPGA